MHFSGDGQDLTLTPVEGVSLHWRRAPECGWTQFEGAGVSDASLCGALVRSMPLQWATTKRLRNVFTRQMLRCNY